MSEISPSIEILSDEYINSSSKLKCKCIECENVWEISWDNLLQGKGCPDCGYKNSAKKRKYTLKHIKSELSNISPSIIINSNDYNGSKGYLECECSICGHEWETTWSVLKNAHGCPKCSYKRRAHSLRMGIPSIRDIIKSNGFNVDFNCNSYNNIHEDRVDYKCNTCGHMDNTTFGNLMHNGCVECKKTKKRLTIGECQKNISKPNIKILSDEYIDSISKLKCMCEICGNIWHATYNSLAMAKKPTGCPECAKETKRYNSILYNITYAKRYKKEWEKIPAIVYVLKVYDDKELFYKIGITKKTVEERFRRKIDMPYMYEILEIIETNLYKAIFIESDLLGHHRKLFMYKPKVQFGGHTECFSEVDLDYIEREMIKNGYK